MKRIVLSVACCVPLLVADDGVLIRGGTVHPVSKPDIAHGDVLVRDGKIVEVGSRIAAPRGARVVDATGLHVYPGLIDSATNIGLSEISSVAETNDVSDVGDFNPQLRAIVAINPASEHIAVTRANGITTAVTAPEGGTLSGQGALINLDGWTWQQMALKPSAAMMLRFPVVGGGRRSFFENRPRTPFKEAKREYDRRLQQVREFFEQARRYQRAKAANAAGFETDLKLEAMLPVLEGKLPLVIQASRERAIKDALEFAAGEKLRVVLAEATEAYKVAPELEAKNVALILGPTLDLPLEEDDPYDRMFTIPAELYKAGVKFAFGSFGNQFARNLPYQAANAIAYGLPYEEGLKALTLNAAEIWGVADQVGSIDKGKVANLIVTDGDPLETRTQVKYEFIRGRQVDLNNKHKRLYEQYVNRP